MNSYVLDDEEQEILAAFEAGELKSIPDVKKQISKHNQIAEATFKHDKKINIRLANRDLLEIQKLALAEGIPYQALIASVLHKFVDGKFVERQSSNAAR